MRCRIQNLKNYNFSQNVQRTATDLPVTCHTGIEGEGWCTCNPFSLLALRRGWGQCHALPIIDHTGGWSVLPVSRVQCVNFCLKNFQSSTCWTLVHIHCVVFCVWKHVESKCKIAGVSEELVPFPSRSEFKMVHNYGLLEHYYVTSADYFNVGTPISTSRSSRDILKDPGDKLGDSCADSRQIGLSTANTPTDDSS